MQQKNTLYFFNQLSLVFFLISSVVISSAMANPEIKGSPTDVRHFLHANQQTVFIEGTASESVYSDKAVVSLIVTSKSEKLTQAIVDNNDLNKKVLKDLANNGISSFKIESSNFTASPQYRWQEKQPSRYTVISRVKIHVSDNLQLQQIASVVDDNEGLSLVDTSFRHSDKQKFFSKVKGKAMQSVLAQKKFYEKKLDVILTPIGIDEASVNTEATPGARALELSLGNTKDEESVADVNDKDKANASVSSSNEAILFPVSYDEVEYHATVSVEFKITPKEDRD